MKPKLTIEQMYNLLAEQFEPLTPKKIKKFKNSVSKTIIIRAKLAHSKKVFRDFTFPTDQTLETLAHTILDYFDFDNDHLYGFGNNPKGFYKSPVQYTYNPDESDEVDIPLKDISFFQNKGDKMSFLFDFGDSWLFEIDHRGDNPEDSKVITLVKSQGEAPEQYPNWDEE